MRDIVELPQDRGTYFSRLGVASERLLGEDEFTVDDDFKSAAF